VIHVSLTDVPERAVRWFDDQQQERRWLSQPVAVIRKYADDRGSALAGLVTFQVFLGMLPLLVVALTVFGRILDTSEDLEEAVLDSAVAQFPVIGGRLEADVTSLAVEGPWVAITIAGLLWTSAGIYHSFQLALNQVWNVGGVSRQGFLSRHLRALVLFVLVFTAAIGTYFLRQFSSGLLGDGAVGTALAALTSAVTASVLLLGVIRLVTAPVVTLRDQIPAAVAAGVMWEALQRVGAWIVLDRLGDAEDLYGAIGFVVVTLFWINLLARSVVLANEFAVVQRRRLWPRRIAQPPLTVADRRVLAGLVNNERRRPEEVIHLHFDEGGSDDDGRSGGGAIGSAEGDEADHGVDPDGVERVAPRHFVFGRSGAGAGDGAAEGDA
jgi:YihY family inner membrane protein